MLPPDDLAASPHWHSDTSKNPSAMGAAVIRFRVGSMEGRRMAGQRGFFDADERLNWLLAAGDPLERLSGVVDFELFRADLERA